METDKFYLQKRTLFLILLFSTLTILSRVWMLDSSLNRVWWLWDDALYISVADSLRKGQGFMINFLEYNDLVVRTYTPHKILGYKYEVYESVSHPLRTHGPIYPMLLSFVFFMFSAEPSNWYYLAILTNMCITVFIAIIMYFFALRIYDHTTALLSSIIVVLLPPVYWFSLRALPHPLLFLLTLLTFHVANKASTYKMWFFTGILVALTHLTYPQGVLVFIALFIWCMYKKYVKELLVMITSYIVALFPWLLRNYLVFNDPFEGLAIPLKPILMFFGIEYGSKFYVSVWSWSINPLNVIAYIPKELIGLYHMNYVLFLLPFTILGFFTLRDKKILVPQFLFVLFSFLSYIYLGFATSREFVETKYLIPSFLLLLPLSIHGLLRVSHLAVRHLKKFLACVMITMLLIVGAVNLTDFAISLDKSINKPFSEKANERHFHEWLRSQNLVKEDDVVLTNAPHVLFLRTGLHGLLIPTKLLSNNSLVCYLINKYNVSYIVSYYSKIDKQFLSSYYDITELYSSGNIFLYKVRFCSQRS